MVAMVVVDFASVMLVLLTTSDHRGMKVISERRPLLSSATLRLRKSRGAGAGVDVGASGTGDGRDRERTGLVCQSRMAERWRFSARPE